MKDKGRRLFVVGMLGLVIFLLTGSISANDKFTQVGSFKAFEGDIRIAGKQIKLYLGLTDYLQKHGKKKLKEKYPGWEGNSHLIYNYQWGEAEQTYELSGRSFGGLTSKRVQEIIEGGKKTANIEDKSWANFLPAGWEVKAYQEADLDNNGTQEVAVFLRQPTEENVLHKPARLIILRPKGRDYDEYELISKLHSRRYENWASCTSLIKLKIAEINGDGVPEIMVWSVSLGASGYTTTLDIFALDKGQQFINVNK